MPDVKTDKVSGLSFTISQKWGISQSNYSNPELQIMSFVGFVNICTIIA